MGCNSSTIKFVVNPNMEGQDECAVAVFESLGFDESDIDLLFAAFWELDTDNSGTIMPSEFFSFFQMESTAFESSVFDVFDQDKSGMINFMEFVCALWNLLTLSIENLGSMAFLTKDPTGDKTIKFADVRSILETMHKKKLESVSSLLDIFNEFRSTHSASISMNDFCSWTKQHQFLMSPLGMLQMYLQGVIIGQRFWERMKEARVNDPDMNDIKYVNKLITTVIDKKKEHHARLKEREEERQRLARLGMGREGDIRDNEQRRQSRVMSFFNMKIQKSFIARRAVYVEDDRNFQEGKYDKCTGEASTANNNGLYSAPPVDRSSPATSSSSSSGRVDADAGREEGYENTQVVTRHVRKHTAQQAKPVKDRHRRRSRSFIKPKFVRSAEKEMQAEKVRTNIKGHHLSDKQNGSNKTPHRAGSGDKINEQHGNQKNEQGQHHSHQKGLSKGHSTHEAGGTSSGSHKLENGSPQQHKRKK